MSAVPRAHSSEAVSPDEPAPEEPATSDASRVNEYDYSRAGSDTPATSVSSHAGEVNTAGGQALMLNHAGLSDNRASGHRLNIVTLRGHTHQFDIEMFRHAEWLGQQDATSVHSVAAPGSGHPPTAGLTSDTSVPTTSPNRGHDALSAYAADLTEVPTTDGAIAVDLGAHAHGAAVAGDLPPVRGGVWGAEPMGTPAPGSSSHASTGPYRGVPRAGGRDPWGRLLVAGLRWEPDVAPRRTLVVRRRRLVAAEWTVFFLALAISRPAQQSGVTYQRGGTAWRTRGTTQLPPW